MLLAAPSISKRRGAGVDSMAAIRDRGIGETRATSAISLRERCRLACGAERHVRVSGL